MKKGRTVLQAKRFGIHSCSPHTSLVRAIRIMVDEEVSSLVVQDDEGALVGLITRLDILQAHVELDNWASRQVSEHMRTDVLVVRPQTLIVDAARLMFDSNTRQVVVVLEDEGQRRPVAVLSDADLAYHLVKGD